MDVLGFAFLSHNFSLAFASSRNIYRWLKLGVRIGLGEVAQRMIASIIIINCKSLRLFHHDCRICLISSFSFSSFNHTTPKKNETMIASIIIINWKSFQFACFGGPTQTCKISNTRLPKIFFCGSHDCFASIGSKLIDKSNF